MQQTYKVWFDFYGSWQYAGSFSVRPTGDGWRGPIMPEQAKAFVQAFDSGESKKALVVGVFNCAMEIKL